MDIHELDVVRLKDGREGTVVGLYEGGAVLMLELCDDRGHTLDTPFIPQKEIAEITYHA